MTDMRQPDLEVVIGRDPVASSNIASAGYDAMTRTLEVEFSNGGIYRYGDVPSDVAWPVIDEVGAWAFAAVATGQATAHISRPRIVVIKSQSWEWSVGRYFSAAIKEGGYPFARIGR